MGDEEATETPSGGQPTESETRRRFLQALGAASAVAGAGGVASAQNTTEGEETTTEDGAEGTATTEGDQTTVAEDATTIVLGGRTDYWLGLAPKAIEGEQNPTLQLREGEPYRLVWVNLDGVEHELVVEGSERADGEDTEGEDGEGESGEDGTTEAGEDLVATDSTEEVGATASVTFTAGEAMAEYYCEYHPEQMRGLVELGEGFQTTTEAETETEDGETTAEDEDTTVASGEITDVAVGPDGQYLKFVPEEVEISVGDTVRWTAESEGHNVSAKEEAASQVELPEGAEPFSSYEGSRSFLVMQVGETFEHTFSVPGTYVYVCAPHASEGMVGRVVVNE
jgi:plastocyanin